MHCIHNPELRYIYRCKHAIPLAGVAGAIESDAPVTDWADWDEGAFGTARALLGVDTSVDLEGTLETGASDTPIEHH